MSEYSCNKCDQFKKKDFGEWVNLICKKCFNHYFPDNKEDDNV